MLWNQRYKIKSYLSASLWFVPFIALLAYWVFTQITHSIGGWQLQNGRLDEKIAFFALTMDSAKTMIGTIITLNLSFLVFAFSSLLVAIQVASGQYTPRIISTALLRNNAIRFTVGYFVFTMLFALSVQLRMRGEIVHQFNCCIAGVLGLISVAVFLYLIDYAARLLRPVSIVKRIGEYGAEVIEKLYPDTAGTEEQSGASSRAESFHRTVAYTGRSGSIMAVDIEGLVKQAQRTKGIIEFIPQIGDFVAVDEPIFRLHGGAVSTDEKHLQSMVAVGQERTIEQDPTFAFRILVDIAIKALSAAINDPTTAVLAIDQLQRLLRKVGMRHLAGENIRDDSGELRLIFRTPNWEDFVHLTCTEIRHCGAGSVQIMRRMRSMLENLMQTLPRHCHAELGLQLELLDRTIEKQYPFPEDRKIAKIPDSQGLGGRLGLQPVKEPPSA
ncbi:MAG: DUF2254 domain-containing protein [Desulfococcaceae bacterium]